MTRGMSNAKALEGLAIRAKHQRIGALVCEHAATLRFLAAYRVNWPKAKDALEAILKEVEL